LLESGSGNLVRCLGLDHRQHEIPGVTEQVVGAFGRAPSRLASYNDDAAIGEAFLLADLIVAPSSGIKLRQDEFSAGVGFSNHKARSDVPVGIVADSNDLVLFEQAQLQQHNRE
jgi:hypothetical protein